MFKITRLLNNWSMNWPVFIIGVFLATNLWAGWSGKQLLYDSTAGFWGMVLGGGRNDGVSRFYLACSDSTVKEYRPGEGYQTIGRGRDEMYDIALGPGRNDGVNRVYAACFDGSVYEYTYSASLWNTSVVGSTYKAFRGVTLGIGRNDDSVRIYAWTNSTIFEFTFREGSWHTDTTWNLLPPPPNINITVGPGRNDSINRVYTKTAESLLEFTYSKGRWYYDTLKTAETGGSLAIGCVYSDTNRIYLGTRDWINDGKLLEYTFKAGHWCRSIINSLHGQGFSSICLGSIRADGKIGVYVSTVENDINTCPTKVEEYSYSGSVWNKDEVGVVGWSQDGRECTDLIIGSMCNDTLNHLYCSVWGWGWGYGVEPHGCLFEFTQTADVEENPSLIAKNIILFPNQPNPFHFSTLVAYQVRKRGNISIRVFDCTGRSIKTLINQEKEPGHYQIYWEGRDDRDQQLPEGVYFCRLETKDYHTTQKIVRVR